MAYYTSEIDLIDTLLDLGLPSAQISAIVPIEIYVGTSEWPELYTDVDADGLAQTALTAYRAQLAAIGWALEPVAADEFLLNVRHIMQREVDTAFAEANEQVNSPLEPDDYPY